MSTICQSTGPFGHWIKLDIGFQRGKDQQAAEQKTRVPIEKCSEQYEISVLGNFSATEKEPVSLNDQSVRSNFVQRIDHIVVRKKSY